MTNTVNAEKLSSARFATATDAFVEVFTASVDFDQRMAAQDIQGSIAHAKMLCGIGVLTSEELASIQTGLQQINTEIASGTFQWSVKQEDVHMNIEARLTDLIGIAGKKLHTGRSRNDQVATDIRLYLRAEITTITAQLHRLQVALLELAAKNSDTIMPGFTHLQVAQPVTFSTQTICFKDKDLTNSLNYYYVVTAVDTHGNESGFTLLTPQLILGVDAAELADFALEGARPNPAMGRGLNVAFALRTATDARLDLVDASGRRVLSREVGSLGAGRHSVDLTEGRKLPPGLYWVRLTQGVDVRTTRVAVLD